MKNKILELLGCLFGLHAPGPWKRTPSDRGILGWKETDDGVLVNHGAGPDMYSKCSKCGTIRYSWGLNFDKW